MEHVTEYHAVLPTFAITCGMNGCLRKFKNFLSFRTHMYQWHGGDPNVFNNPAVFMFPSNQRPTEELVNILVTLLVKYMKKKLRPSVLMVKKEFFHILMHKLQS